MAICDLSKLKLDMKLLWTNPNITADYPSQTVNIDLSPYDYVIIDSGFINSVNVLVKTVIKVGKTGYCIAKNSTNSSSENDSSYVYRSATVAKTGITFGLGNFVRQTGQFIGYPAYAAPYHIWGIKCEGF